MSNSSWIKLFYTAKKFFLAFIVFEIIDLKQSAFWALNGWCLMASTKSVHTNLAFTLTIFKSFNFTLKNWGIFL